jgi:hypothetical protein
MDLYQGAWDFYHDVELAKYPRILRFYGKEYRAAETYFRAAGTADALIYLGEMYSPAGAIELDRRASIRRSKRSRKH